MSDLAIIERDSRISESLLWDLQDKFYKNHGIEFWRERASFSSANTLVVSASVELLISFLKDQRAYIDSESPIYFVELGTGSGCFAYRFLQEFFLRMSSCPEISNLDVRYVMTDFIPEIISIWRANPFLKTFVDSRKLDFAVFDPACEQAIATGSSGWLIDPRSCANAPLFIANALFDTIGVDGFRFADGEVSEVLISTEANPDDPMSSLINNTLVIHQKIGEVVPMHYYDNCDFNKLIEEYSSNLRRGVLSMPIRALEILNNLRTLTGGRMALLCCSRGFSDLRYAEVFEQLQYSDLSFPLNFDALKRYFATIGGELLLPRNLEDTFVTRCLSFGYVLPEIQRADLPRTRVQYPVAVNQLETATASVHQKMTKRLGSAKSAIAWFVDVIATGHFDPPLFLKCVVQMMDAIELELPNAPESDVAELLDLLHKVDSNIYTFDRALPESMSAEADVFSYLIRVWQRASAAHHQPVGRSFFEIAD